MPAIRQLKVRYYALYSTGVNWWISVTAMTGDRSAIRMSALGQERSSTPALPSVRFAPKAVIQQPAKIALP